MDNSIYTRCRTLDALLNALRTNEPNESGLTSTVNFAALNLIVFSPEKPEKRIVLTRLKVLIATMTDGFEMKIGKRVTSRLYRLDNNIVQNVATFCERNLLYGLTKYEHATHFALEVYLGQEKVYLIFRCDDSEPHKIVDEIKTGKLAHALFAVYSNAAYSLRSNKGRTLLKAVALEVPPSIIALIRKDKSN